MYQDSYREDNVYSKYRNLKLDSCLMVGLGELELIPKWIEKTKPHCTVDIVEKDKTKTSELSYNVIYADAFDYIPTKKYDLVIIDIWYAFPLNYRAEIEFLKLKYFHYLNVGGNISFPMVDMHTVYSYVELQRQINYSN